MHNSCNDSSQQLNESDSVWFAAVITFAFMILLCWRFMETRNDFPFMKLKFNN